MMRKILKMASFIFFLFMYSTVVSGQIKFTVEPSELNLIVGSKPKTVVIKAEGTDPFPDKDTSVIWSGAEGFVEITQMLAEDRRSISSTFKALKPVTSQTLTAKIGKEEKPLKLTVLPEITLEKLDINPLISATDSQNGIEIIKDGVRTFSLTPKDKSASIPSTALSASSDIESIATAKIENISQLVIEAKNTGTTIIHLLGWGDRILNLKVTVTEGVNFNTLPNVITIKKGEKNVDLQSKMPGIDINKLNIGKPRERNIAEISDVQKLSGNEVGQTPFEVSLKGNDKKTQTITINVKLKPAKITFSNFDGTQSLINGQPKEIIANVESDDGRIIDNVSIQMKSDNEICVSVRSLSNNRFTITPEGNCSVKLTAEATIDGEKVTGELNFRVKNIVGFSPLGIRFDILDTKIAKDLFGSTTANEFFVAKVRLFNRILEDKSDPNSFNRNAILVYSESLEVKVAAQYKCGDDAVKPCDEKDWTNLDEAKLKIFFPKGFPPLTMDPQKCQPDVEKDFYMPYRPFVFEMMTNTQDSRADRSTRSKVMTTVNGLSTVASFVTSIAVPGSSSDLPLGLDKFKNLLIPSIERLFPSMREVHRQNLIRWTMRPLEEVPFGSDITRIVFFPRSPIRGVIPGYLVKITGISISNACADVAFIQKITNL